MRCSILLITLVCAKRGGPIQGQKGVCLNFHYLLMWFVLYMHVISTRNLTCRSCASFSPHFPPIHSEVHKSCCVQEAILLVGAATSPLELRLAVTSALHTALPDLVCSLVLLLDVETQQLAYFETNDSPIYMPTSGVVWDSVRRRSADTLAEAIPTSDPIRKLSPALPPSLEDGQVVVVLPVLPVKGHQIVAVMLAVCSKLQPPHEERFQWLKKNVLVASQRVMKNAVAEKERRRAEGMLRVCGDLIDLDSSILLLKIHKHLKSILDAKASMVLIVDEVTNELICQTFDDVALDTPFTLPMAETLYGRCVESGHTIVIDNVAEDMRYNPAVDTVNNYEPSSMICMPVQVQREDHSAPKTIAVAVVFDKTLERGGKFTSRDVENMGFVLQFSSTLLANTLAYQREMLLRKHNMALLEMARNLFSSVSKFLVVLYYNILYIHTCHAVQQVSSHH
jgi:hypothetical protein